MKAIEFEEQTVVYAKDQPEYAPLPAHCRLNDQGEIVVCWKLTFRERVKLLFTGKLWHSIYTFNRALQPQLLEVDKPRMEKRP